MKGFILDASVFVKWVLPEPEHLAAKCLIDAECSLRAPDLIVPECLSIFLKRVVRKELTFEQSGEVLQQLRDDYIDTRVRLIPSRLLTENALKIAWSEKISSYDSLYLALAVQAGCRLITADRRLLEQVRHRSLRKHVVHLTDPQLQGEIAEMRGK